MSSSLPSRAGFLAGITAVAASPFVVPTIVIAAGPKEKLQVAVGSEHALVYFPWDLAKSLGYFDAEGLDVDIFYTKGGSEAATALVGGSVDYSGNAIDHAISAAQQGKSLVMISDFMDQPGITLLTPPRTSIKSFKELKGKKVGVTSIGSATHVLGVWMAKRAGLSRDDVSFITVGGGSTMSAALNGNQVDAAFGNDPYATQLLRSNRAVAAIELFRPSDTRAHLGFSSYCFTGALTRADVIAKNSERTQKVVNALVRAQKYMASHSAAQIANLLSDEFRGGIAKDDWAAGYGHSRPAYTPNGEITSDAVAAVIATNDFFLDKKSTVEPAKLFDASFVEKAKRSVRG